MEARPKAGRERFKSSLISIVSVVVVDSSTVDITFSADPSLDDGADAGSAFQIAGTAPDQLQTLSPTVMELIFFGGGINPGDAWLLNSQPAWVGAPLLIPESGHAT